jgi:predicted nucleic acid-binding protein
MPAECVAFVDTNVLVYAFDRADKRRQPPASQLIERLGAANNLRLSTQVLQEFFVTVTRKIAEPLAIPEALELLDDFLAWPLFVVDPRAIKRAGRLCYEAQLSFWDALIVVAAARSGARVLYTEDLNAGQKIEGIEVINPFA